MKFYFTSQEKSWVWGGYHTLNEPPVAVHACIYIGSIHCINKLLCAPLHAVTEMLVNVLSLKDDDLADEGDEKIKPGSGIFMYSSSPKQNGTDVSIPFHFISFTSPPPMHNR